MQSAHIHGRTTSFSMSGDNLEEEDEKDETKRKSRNMSEKKRRDQFNTLITELGTMVSQNNRKMDKTTVLKTTISFLKQHNEMSQRSQSDEIQSDWKPQFLSTEEFTHLMLEAIDGFILVLGTDGHILYTSESLASLLGYLPSSLHNTTLYEIVADGDKIPLYNTLNVSHNSETSDQHQIKLLIHIRRSSVHPVGEDEEVTEQIFELVELSGYFRKWVNPTEPTDGCASDDDDKISLKSCMSLSNTPSFRLPPTEKIVFVATGRLVTPQLIRELPVVHSSQSEFVSRHSLEWKFLLVDHRAPPIIGYLTFELLGTSGYDYYHSDDLDQVAACHEALMQTGECTSCYYRFLTKGQQWIWLQTRYYITYHQWNSKPEFIVANHKVINYKEVLNQHDAAKTEVCADNTTDKQSKTHSFRSGSPTWSSKSSMCGSDRTGFASSSRMTDSLASEGHPAFRGGGGNGNRPPVMAVGGPPSVASDQDQVDTYSVTSGGSIMYREPGHQEDQGPGDRVYLTPAQVALQTQLKSKHAELSRRIALQQAELLRLGEQLALTYRDPGSFFNNHPPQQQQQVVEPDQINVVLQQPQQQQQQQYLASPSLSQPPNLIQPQSIIIRSHQQLPTQQQQLNLGMQQQPQHQIAGMDVSYNNDVMQHQFLPSNT